jgi:hypothetical protein
MASTEHRDDRWLHAALAVGLSVCAVGFLVELRRGTHGHYLAWVYVFEWPFFAACGLYLWWRLRHDEDVAEPSRAAQTDIAADDPELAAWQAHVARMESEQLKDQEERP